METKTNLATKIKSLKVGESFTVQSKRERVYACRTAKTLKEARVIKFNITTRANGDGTFKVVAI